MVTYKEQLSKHVEGIFKGYTEPGLHICDIATGGGKSYTIGKLTCEYYPNVFDRIIILRRSTGRFFDPLKMAESITDSRIYGFTEISTE